MQYISLVQAGSGAYASIAAARGGESNDAAPAQALPDPLAVLSASILGLKQDFAHQSRIVQLLRRIKQGELKPECATCTVCKNRLGHMMSGDARELEGVQRAYVARLGTHKALPGQPDRSRDAAATSVVVGAMSRLWSQGSRIASAATGLWGATPQGDAPSTQSASDDASGAVASYQRTTQTLRRLRDEARQLDTRIADLQASHRALAAAEAKAEALTASAWRELDRYAHGVGEARTTREDCLRQVSASASIIDQLAKADALLDLFKISTCTEFLPDPNAADAAAASVARHGWVVPAVPQHAGLAESQAIALNGDSKPGAMLATINSLRLGHFDEGNDPSWAESTHAIAQIARLLVALAARSRHEFVGCRITAVGGTARFHFPSSNANVATVPLIIDGRLRSDRQRQQLFDTGMVALLECILGLFDRGREATGTHSWEPRYHIQSKECVIGGLSLSLGRRRSRSHCFSWAEWNKAASMLLETCSQLRDLVVAVW